jgi:hypothetical protein
MRRIFGVLAFVSAALHGQQRIADPNIDFRNFTYPFPAQNFIPVPDKLSWMSLNVKPTVTLVNGRYDFDQAIRSAGPTLILDRVLYGNLTSAKQLDAVAVLHYYTGGDSPLGLRVCLQLGLQLTKTGWLVPNGIKGGFRPIPTKGHESRIDRGPARS